jgi:hypothetical protein
VSAAALTAAWIEAGATVIAVGAAIYAGIYAKKAYDKEVERDERREQDRRSSQAEKVAAWCERYDYSDAEPSRVIGGSGVVGMTRAKPEPSWNYYLRNASDVPVYDVVVLFRIGEHSLGTDALDVLPPGDEPITREVPKHVKREARAGREEYGEVLRPFISFRDSGGRAWRRTDKGRLVPHTDPGEPPPPGDD